VPKKKKVPFTNVTNHIGMCGSGTGQKGWTLSKKLESFTATKMIVILSKVRVILCPDALGMINEIEASGSKSFCKSSH
jgi:hypothetical protein